MEEIEKIKEQLEKGNMGEKKVIWGRKRNKRRRKRYSLKKVFWEKRYQETAWKKSNFEEKEKKMK